MTLKIGRRVVDEGLVGRLGALNPVLARAYAARGIDDPSRLRPSLDRLLPVGTLEGVEAAVALLLAHRRSGQ